jgi:hypothetical protein
MTDKTLERLASIITNAAMHELDSILNECRETGKYEAYTHITGMEPPEKEPEDDTPIPDIHLRQDISDLCQSEKRFTINCQEASSAKQTYLDPEMENPKPFRLNFYAPPVNEKTGKRELTKESLHEFSKEIIYKLSKFLIEPYMKADRERERHPEYDLCFRQGVEEEGEQLLTEQGAELLEDLIIEWGTRIARDTIRKRAKMPAHLEGCRWRVDYTPGPGDSIRKIKTVQEYFAPQNNIDLEENEDYCFGILIAPDRYTDLKPEEQEEWLCKEYAMMVKSAVFGNIFKLNMDLARHPAKDNHVRKNGDGYYRFTKPGDDIHGEVVDSLTPFIVERMMSLLERGKAHEFDVRFKLGPQELEYLYISELIKDEAGWVVDIREVYETEPRGEAN